MFAYTNVSGHKNKRKNNPVSMKKIWLFIIVIISCETSLHAQENDSLFFSIRSEKYTWIFEDNMSGPLFKHNAALISSDSLRIHISKIFYDKNQSKLFISGYLINPVKGWSDEGIIITGCKRDSIVEIGFTNDHTGTYKENIRAIKFTDFDSCRFKKLDKFNCTLNIKPNYDFLIICKDSCYGLVFDLKKIIKIYGR